MTAAIGVAVLSDGVGLASQAGVAADLPKWIAPEGARRLAPEQAVWVDGAKRVVYVGGRIAVRDGALEMFACPAGTKEHESIVAVASSAFLIHTALLAVGAEPGAPVRFDPKYRPPSGAKIEVRVEWREDGDLRAASAQEWVRQAETGAAMDLPFVFAGSGFWTDPDTGEQHYLAEAGDLICVSNFGSAMLDVPAPSTQENAELWFEPFTERIPAEGTPVRLTLRPVADGAGPQVTEPPPAAAPDLSTALRVLLDAQVGAGSTPAVSEAWSTVAAATPERLVEVLTAMNSASPLATNWLRSAIDSIVESAPPGRLPLQALRSFFVDRTNAPRARRTAFELLRIADAERAESLLDDALDDPSVEVRYDAVARLLDRAKGAEESEREPMLMRALRSARALGQIEITESRLRDVGVEVSLADELGFVSSWRVAGPFDNRDGVGFDLAYPPEEALDASASYEGHDEEGPQGPFSWRPFTTSDRLGEVDLNTAIGSHKGAVGYAWAVIRSDDARPIQVRYTSRAATKVWVNGEQVATHEVYHDGSDFDQYRAAAQLRAGENTVLIKACQNEQTEPWAQVWFFKLRLTDEAGGRLEGVTVEAPAEEDAS